MREINDGLSVKGEFTVELWRDGPRGPECHHRQTVPNTVLQTGLKEMYRFLVGSVVKQFDQGRIGTCGAAAASNQTNLLSPFNGLTGTLTTVDQMTFTGTRTMEWKWSYPSGAGNVVSGSIKELAILSQATSPGGTALARGVITTASKTKSDKLICYYRQRAA